MGDLGNEGRQGDRGRVGKKVKRRVGTYVWTRSVGLQGEEFEDIGGPGGGEVEEGGVLFDVQAGEGGEGDHGLEGAEELLRDVSPYVWK